MRRMLRLFHVTLFLAVGLLSLGIVAQAQENPGFVAAEAEAGSDALWQKLAALQAELDAGAVTAAIDLDAIAERVNQLLLGDDQEPGVIDLVRELAGVADTDPIDAQAVIAAGVESHEVIALAHLILAAQAVTDSPTTMALLEAGEHVREADRLLAHLKPASPEGE